MFIILKVYSFNYGFSACDLWIYTSGKLKGIIRINTRTISLIIDQTKDFKGIDVNRTLPSLHGMS